MGFWKRVAGSIDCDNIVYFLVFLAILIEVTFSFGGDSPKNYRTCFEYLAHIELLLKTFCVGYSKIGSPGRAIFFILFDFRSKTRVCPIFS